MIKRLYDKKILVFLHTDRETPLSIIRNKEWILLNAEANISVDSAATVTALNLIRQSAGLNPYTGLMDVDTLTQEILNQCIYSLYGEGHRWVDVRRYDLLQTLPIDMPERTDVEGNVIETDDIWINFPIPLTENQ